MKETTKPSGILFASENPEVVSYALTGVDPVCGQSDWDLDILSVKVKFHFLTFGGISRA